MSELGNIVFDKKNSKPLRCYRYAMIEAFLPGATDVEQKVLILYRFAVYSM
jgi:hypothetical protein